MLSVHDFLAFDDAAASYNLIHILTSQIHLNLPHSLNLAILPNLPDRRNPP